MKSGMLICALIVWLLAGCAYKYINQLQIGMTEAEVWSLLGSKGQLKAATVANDGSAVKIYLYAFLDENYFFAFRDDRLVGLHPAGSNIDPNWFMAGFLIGKHRSR